jgi:hypothetical protein
MAMYVLDSTTKTIKVAMSAAAATTNPDYTVAYADNNGTVFTEGATDGVLNGTTDVTVCSAPAASTRRIVKAMTINNRDTAAVTLYIKYDNNGTQRRLTAVTLSVGETWTMDGAYDAYGNFKQSASAGAILSITGFSGNIYYQLPTSMTISGLGFNGLMTVRFSFGGTVADVSVTPSNTTTLNVNMPSTIYNLGNSPSGTVTLIDSANRQSNAISTYVYTVPTGGIVSTSGSYKIHTFTSTSTFTTGSYTPVGGYEVLVVAGGGPGGNASNVMGGGGAGGLAYFASRALLSSTAYAVTIGAGGSVGANGSNSSLGTDVQAVGGGKANGESASGSSGGSGGGGSYGAAGGTSIQVSTYGYGYGNAGGTGGGSYAAAGGGGAGAAGSNGNPAGTVAGNGGIGLQYSITGVATYYAGGGAGATWTTGNTSASGGLGGGGNGGFNGAGGGVVSTAGTANTGGGGGGGYDYTYSRSGGSGIVIVKYLLS